MKTLGRTLKAKAFCFTHYEVQRESYKTKKTGNFDLLECPDWVNVVAITKDQEVILVKQYRHGIDDMTLEVPAGTIEKNEEPLVAAKRELEEETGFVSENWTYMGKVTPNPAFISNFCHFYVALDCEKKSEQNLDPFEEIEILLRPKADIEQMLSSEEIHHALCVCAFQRYFSQKNL
ncbi:MAG: NUDIX hydrolase [Bacteriovoracaceae bacterium]